MLTHEQKRKWLERLRDPNSKQLRYAWNDSETPNAAMCCLAHGQFAIANDYGSVGSKFSLWNVLDSMDRAIASKLIEMSDGPELCTLPQIADWIEANVPSC